MIAASHASRRTVSGATRAPASDPPTVLAGAAEPASQRLEVDGDEQLALRVRRPPVTGRDRAPHAAGRARHHGAGRSNAGRAHRRPAAGADSGPSAASSTALPSGSRVSRYSANPSSSTRGCDSATNRFAASCSPCNCAVAARTAPADRGRTIRHPRGPCVDRHRDQPVQHRRLRTLGQQRPQPVRLGDHHRGAAHRQHPREHGRLDRRLPDRPRTPAPPRPPARHPPAREDGACRRTHCTGVSASAPDPVSPRLIASPSDQHPRGLTRDHHPVGLGHDLRRGRRPSALHSSSPRPVHRVTRRDHPVTALVQCRSPCHALIVQMSTDAPLRCPQGRGDWSTRRPSMTDLSGRRGGWAATAWPAGRRGRRAPADPDPPRAPHRSASGSPAPR